MLTGKVVTAGNDQLSGCFYIEEADRYSGIKVVPSSGTYSAGDIVEIAGSMATVAGERQITAGTVRVLQSGGTVPDPLGLNIRALGGGPFNEHTPGVAHGRGLNTIGLLVTVCGKVLSTAGNSFWITDGSVEYESSIAASARVICPAGVTPPTAGKYVIVTGISSCVLDRGVSRRVIRARKAADIIEL